MPKKYRSIEITFIDRVHGGVDPGSLDVGRGSIRVHRDGGGYFTPEGETVRGDDSAGWSFRESARGADGNSYWTLSDETGLSMGVYGPDGSDVGSKLHFFDGMPGYTESLPDGRRLVHEADDAGNWSRMESVDGNVRVLSGDADNYVAPFTPPTSTDGPAAGFNSYPLADDSNGGIGNVEPVVIDPVDPNAVVGNGGFTADEQW